MIESNKMFPITTETGITIATIPESYIQLYKRVIPLDLRNDATYGLLSQVEDETGIVIESLYDLELASDYYKQYGFMTVCDYILFYMTQQIAPYIRVCKSCKQYYRGECLTFGCKMGAMNWACKEFL